MPLAYDDEPGSWGRQSEGWPETSDRVHDKQVFLAKLTTPPVPLGSYVCMGDTLRVETPKLLVILDETFAAAGSPTAEQLMARYHNAVKATVGSSNWPTLDPWW